MEDIKGYDSWKLSAPEDGLYSAAYRRRMSGMYRDDDEEEKEEREEKRRWL